MRYTGKRLSSIAISPDDTVRSPSANKQTPLTQYCFAIGTAAVLIAIVCGVLLIGAAALTAAYIRFDNPFAAVNNELLLVIIPAFLLAGLALDCYQIKTLRHSLRSVEKL